MVFIERFQNASTAVYSTTPALITGIMGTNQSQKSAMLSRSEPMSIDSANNKYYDFSAEQLWLGRLSSFTQSIESNLKLLRVILLAKFSFIGEVERSKEYAKEKSKGLLGNWSKAFEDKGVPIPERTLDTNKLDNLPFEDYEFEEKQLLNLRTLCLNQKEFVENKLKKGVEAALAQQDASKIALVRDSFGRISKDIEIVQRAIVQRVHEVSDKGKYAQSKQAAALEMTDKLALMALAHFQHLLPSGQDVTPITFFSQETHVRTMPYCDDVLLIGIRYDQITQEGTDAPPPFELVAIPHEIGHFIYQRATIDFEAVGEKALPQNSRYLKWSEEIFSDVCGCIVAGPLVGVSLLSILASRSDEENQSLEGEHPIGVLRPYILAKILELLGEKSPNHSFNKASSAITNNWKSTLQHAGYTIDNDKIIKGKNTFQISETVKELTPLIDAYIKKLFPDSASKTVAKIWSKTDDDSIVTYVTHLKQLEKISGLDNIEPSELERGTFDSEESIEELIEEWKKKGPVTIGGH